MFGLEFLFVHALWAVPLAGLPVLLHLLFRKKSPVVQFPTLRFIKSSLQQTAARKKVQRWMLLACRMLLLLLLIWAIAQPARKLAASWLGGGESIVAAIVVDTSYSMQLRDGDVPLLDTAGAAIEQLLRNELANARVAIFPSQPPPADRPERLETATALLSQWTPLRAQPGPQPLAGRVAAALELLKSQDANQKWLVVLSDLQSREFQRPLAGEIDGVRVVLIDLHPAEARSAGITQVSVEPPQPIAGIESQVIVEVTGRRGESRAVTVELLDAGGTSLQQLPPQMASLDAGGRTRVRFPVTFPHQRWITVRAGLGADDAMPWDNQRQHLVEIPPQQKVTLVDSGLGSAGRFTALALDPSEGRLASWPLVVHRSNGPGGQENVLVALLDRWPDLTVVQQWRDLVRSGGTLVLMLKPGIEQSWSALPEAHRAALAELLPSAPMGNAIEGTYATTVAAVDEPLLRGIVDQNTRLDTLLTRRIVGFAPVDRQVSAILNTTSIGKTGPSRAHGLVYRRTLDGGRVFTLATLPEARFSNLATHPIFLPLMVKMSLRPVERSAALNGEIGRAMTLAASHAPVAKQVEVQAPTGERFVVPVGTSATSGPQFAFDAATSPGLYAWHVAGQTEPVAMGNVSLPSEESDLDYRPADQVIPAGEQVVVARSIDELRSKMSELTEPQPRWSWAVALVLFLLCLEAMMGSVSRFWNPGGLFPMKRANA